MAINKATFTKISGFKRVVKCRGCGIRITGGEYTYYCDKCIERMRKGKEEEEAAAKEEK